MHDQEEIIRRAKELQDNKKEIKKEEEPFYKNTYSFIGFILSLVLFIIPVILCIIGINKSKYYRNGKVLGISGICIVLLKIVVLFIFFDGLFPNVRKDFVNNLNCMNAYNCIDNKDGTSTCKYKKKDIICDSDKVNSKEEETNVSDTSNYVEDSTYFDDYDYGYIKDKYGDMYNFKSYRIPSIKINSDYASMVNNEILSKADDVLSIWRKASKLYKSKQDVTDIYESFNYSAFLNDNILSLIVKYKYNTSSTTYLEYMVYNINVETGEKVTNEEILESKGISLETLKEKAIYTLDELYQDWWDDLTDELNDELYNDWYVSRRNTMLYKVNEDEPVIYLGYDNKLYYIGILCFPSDAGESEENILIS